MSEKSTAEEQKAKLYTQNVKLCRAVQAQLCVYDRQNPCQKKDCYDKAWEVIAKDCDDTVKSCKVRWRNIRFAFMRSLHPTDARKRQSLRTRDYYLHEDLLFLIPHLNTQTNVSKTTTDSEEDVSLIESKSPEKTPLNAKSSAKKTKTTNDVENELTTSADETDEQQTPPSGSAKTRGNKLSTPEKPNKISKILTTKPDVEKTVEKLEDVKPTPPPNDEDKRDFRFQRACKRSLDKNVVQQLCDVSPRKEVEPKRSRRSTVLRKLLPKTEKNMKAKVDDESPIVDETPKKPKETEIHLPKSAEKAPVEISPPSELSQNQRFDYDLSETSFEPTKMPTPPKCIEPLVALTCEQATQCDTLNDMWDDEFLKTLRPQMAAMNSRQKLNFKQKVYLALMEIFDDATNFPGPGENTTPIPTIPPLIGNVAAGTTTTEMLLIRQLVSMVQAAKSSSELIPEGVSENSEDTQHNGNTADTTTTSTQAVVAQNTTTTCFLDSPRPQIVRKLYKTNTDGTFTTQDGAKPRIFRILPKPPPQVGANKATTSNSSVGTFIIPRAPSSIASSFNAAFAAEAAKKRQTSSSSPPPLSVHYRQLPVSAASTVLVNGQGNSTSQRTMTVRSTVRGPTGSVPRQLVRRYSICGTPGNIGDAVAKKIITTSAGLTPPQLDLRHSTSFGSALTTSTNNRLVRATTVTLPFKLPTAADAATSTTVTQSLKTRATPTVAVSSSSNISPFTLSTSPVNIPIGTMGAMQNFSVSKSNTSTAIVSSNTTLPTIQNTSKESPQQQLVVQPIQGNKNQAKDMPPNLRVAHTAGIIASDDFASFNIKNEPMD